MCLYFNGIQITRSIFKLLITGIWVMRALAFSQEIHRPHLARCSPIVRILGHPNDLKCAGMLQVITEMFSNGATVLEIFLLEEAIHQGHGASRRRVLLIDGPALYDLGSDSVKISRAHPQP